jgi:hypothetical protein
MNKRKRTTPFTEGLEAALEAKGKGSKTGLAYFLGVHRTAVMSWRIGLCVPLYIRWEDIEHYLDMPPGTIEELVSQNKQSV